MAITANRTQNSPPGSWRARDKGLILLSCGPYYNVLRILVPLTIEDAQIRQGLEIINQCFAEAKQ